MSSQRSLENFTDSHPRQHWVIVSKRACGWAILTETDSRLDHVTHHVYRERQMSIDITDSCSSLLPADVYGPH